METHLTDATDLTADRSATPSPAEAYERYFGPAIFAPLAEKVLAASAPPAASEVIDVACGTGILTRRAADVVGADGRVVGVDINADMIEVARTLNRPGGAPIDYAVGDGTALDLASDSFDVAYCQQGLQFFPDREAGAQELRRLVRGGGRAVVAVWQGLDRHPFFARLFEIEAPHLERLGAGFGTDRAAAPFSFGAADELADTLCTAGFGHVELATDTVCARFADADRYIEQMERAYAAVVPAFAADPSAFERYVQAVTEDTRELVATYRDGDDLVVPMHTNVALAE